MKLSRIAMLLPFALLSCGDDPDAPEKGAGTIGFDIADIHPQESSTRAAILYLDGLKKTGFRVNAYFTGAADWQTAGSAAKPEFMYDRPVAWDNGGWTYTPARYWPDKVDGVNYGKVSFFAWNDLNGVTVSGKDEAGPPRLTCTVPNTCTAQKDLVAAVLTDKTKAGGNVSFTFGHAFSRIGFTAKLKDHYPDKTITITSLKVMYAAGAVESTGVYTFGDTEHVAGTWAFPASGKTYMSDVNNGGDEVMTGSVTPDNLWTPVTVRLNSADRYLMLLPQTVAGGAVRMDVTWTVDDGTTLTHRQTIGLPGQVWLPGKHYDYNIRVSPTGITLDPVVVNPWDYNPALTLCILTYNANGGAGDDVIEYRTTNGAYPLAENTFTKQNYTFGGWNTKAGGSGDNYEPGDLFLCTENTTLYAQWIPSTINVGTGAYPHGLVTYGNNVFTIEVDGLYNVVGSTNINGIKVANGVTAEIVLKNAVVDVSAKDICAFDVDGADVTLVLDGDNVLKSGNIYAGLHVSKNARIRITGISGDGSTDGKLTAVGGGSNLTNGGGGAGIGGTAGSVDREVGEAGGVITIAGGTVMAAGGSGTTYSGNGAAIGGGGGGRNAAGGAGGAITITGGTVMAASSDALHYGGSGAGIGGGGGGKSNGVGGSGGTIIVTGGTVTAISGSSAEYSGSGAGIGGGGGGGTSGGVGGVITITGGTVMATSGSASESGSKTGTGAAIGGGGGGDVGEGGGEAKYTGPGAPLQSGDFYEYSNGNTSMKATVGSTDSGKRGEAIGKGGGR